MGAESASQATKGDAEIGERQKRHGHGEAPIYQSVTQTEFARIPPTHLHPSDTARVVYPFKTWFFKRLISFNAFAHDQCLTRT